MHQFMACEARILVDFGLSLWDVARLCESKPTTEVVALVEADKKANHEHDYGCENSDGYLDCGL